MLVPLLHFTFSATQLDQFNYLVHRRALGATILQCFFNVRVLIYILSESGDIVDLSSSVPAAEAVSGESRRRTEPLSISCVFFISSFSCRL